MKSQFSLTYWKIGIFLTVVTCFIIRPQLSQAQSNAYPIVDTGQTICYDAWQAIACPQEQEDQPFYGQDAQFSGNQPSYTLSADGLSVYDNVTGLTWTQSPDLDGDGDIDINDKLTFAEAQSYADTVLNPQNYGGHSDWRLPTIKELYSLMDFRGTDPTRASTAGLTPFIDTTIFDFAYGDETAGERTIDAQFWSSTAYTGRVFGNRAAAFGLNLADGRIKGYPTDGPSSKLNYVYFVRGNPGYGLNDFTTNGDGTVTDHATGLMWAQEDSGIGMTWEEALAWVQQKNDEAYLGYSDWRLPNAKEIQSIVDYARSPDATNSAAIDPVFNITSITNEAGQLDYPWFWTGTTHVRADGSGSAAVYIAFGRAMGYMNNSWMDVHGAGAQRSDPKSGDPADWSLGHGPQGDAIRINNYVRLVRGGDVTATPAGPFDVNLPIITAQETGSGGSLPAGSPPNEQNGQPGPLAGPPQSNPMPGQPNGPGGQPPAEALTACSGQSQGAQCQFTAPHGQITGSCNQIQHQLACVPAGGPPASQSNPPFLANFLGKTFLWLTSFFRTP